MDRIAATRNESVLGRTLLVVEGLAPETRRSRAVGPANRTAEDRRPCREDRIHQGALSTAVEKGRMQGCNTSVRFVENWLAGRKNPSLSVARVA
jgi:hypothetical protein